MPRLHVEKARLGDDSVILSDEDHHYLTRVLRLGPGDRLTLFDGDGGEAEAEIARVGPRASEARVLSRRRVERPPGPELTLVQALARGEKLDLVVQKATELGVARIIPVTTERAVSPDLLRGTSRRQRWEKIAREAARQSGRADLPEIEPVTSFPLALAAAPREALKLLFFEGARGNHLREALPATPPPSAVLAVGPEGGFTEGEVARAREAGFAVVGLGPRTLRTETAAMAVLAIVGYAIGDLG